MFDLKIGGAPNAVEMNVSGKQFKIVLSLVSIALLATGCGTNVPLHSFVDGIREELVKMKAVTRVTVTQLAQRQEKFTNFVKEEQHHQCSSDPILLLLKDSLDFDIKATVGTELGVQFAAIPVPTIKFPGSSDHTMKWKTVPVSLGNLANVVFSAHLEVIKTVRTLEGEKGEITIMVGEKKRRLVDILIEEAWTLRGQIKEVADKLISEWKWPAECPRE